MSEELEVSLQTSGSFIEFRPDPSIITPEMKEAMINSRTSEILKVLSPDAVSRINKSAIGQIDKLREIALQNIFEFLASPDIKLRAFATKEFSKYIFSTKSSIEGSLPPNITVNFSALQDEESETKTE